MSAFGWSDIGLHRPAPDKAPRKAVKPATPGIQRTIKAAIAMNAARTPERRSEIARMGALAVKAKRLARQG